MARPSDRELLIIAVVVLIAVGVLISVLVLRIACSLLGVPRPSYSDAVLIIVVESVATLFAFGVVGAIAVAVLGEDPSDRPGFQFAMLVAAIEVNMFVAAGTYSKWFGINLAKAVLLFWVQGLLVVSITAAFVVPVWLAIN